MSVLKKIENSCDLLGALALLLYTCTMAGPVKRAHANGDLNQGVQHAISSIVDERLKQPKFVNEAGDKAAEVGGILVLTGVLANLARGRRD